MIGKQRYQRAARDRAERKEDRVLVLSGTLGVTTNGENQVEVPGRPGFVWVQLRNQLSELIQAHNESVSPVFGLPVLVEWDKDAPIRYKVRGRDIGRYTVWVTTNSAGDTVSDTSSYLPAHGASHSFNKLTGVGGGDVVWVYGDQFIPWLVTPSGSSGALSVSIQPSAYYYDQQFRWAGGTGITGFDELYPTGSSNARMVLVYLDPDTGNPYLATGTLTEFANTITGTQQIMPYMPSLIEETDIPLAGVRIITGTSRILWQNLYDLRDYFAHSSTSGSSGGGGAPTDAEYVVMSLNGTLTDERVLTAGSDITLADGGAGGNATVGVATGTFSRAGHGHLYPYSVAIYDDHVFQATGTILDFTGNIDVAVTGTSVFISSTAAGGGGSTVLIYDDSTFKVTGSAISFDDNLTVHVTGSTAYVVGQAGGAGGFPIISEDSVFKATGVAIDFGENMNVAVTGTTVYVSSVDTTGGGGSDLLIYDNDTFQVTGTALDFGDYLNVSVTGSIAYINSPFSPTGFDIGARVYNSTNLVITGSSNIDLTFDSEQYDTDNIHSGSSTRLYCNTAGKYLLVANVRWEANATGRRFVNIRVNGTTNIGAVVRDGSSTSSVDTMNVSAIWDMNVGDYGEVRVYQDSGGNLDILSAERFSPEFMMHKIDGGGNAIQVYDDGVWKATGTSIDFGANLDVSVTGNSVWVDGQAGSGGADLLIYDDGAFKVTGTSIDFESGLTVDVTGSSAFINSQFSTPIGIGARAYNSSNITIPSATGVALTFDSERWDTDNIHSIVSNTSRLVCNTAGKYLIKGQTIFAYNATGERRLSILLNDTTYLANHNSSARTASYNDRMEISTVYDLEVGDYVELQALQTSGGNLDINAFSAVSPEFMMQLIEVGDQDNTIQIYDDSVFVATGTAISFDEGLDVVSTGTTAYVGLQDIGARVYNSTGTSVNSGAVLYVPFDSEDYDTDGIHSGSSTQLYCNTAGKYLIVGNMRFESNANGARWIWIRVNGTDLIASNRQNPDDAISMDLNVTTIYDLNVGDYVEIGVNQDSGSPLGISSYQKISPYFMMQKIG